MSIMQRTSFDDRVYRLFVLMVVAIMVIGCTPSRQEVSEASQPAACNVQDVRLLREGGAYPKWSHKRNLIAFNEVVRGNFEIFTMTPAGENATCLTCDKPDAPNTGHKGQPYWHPRGDYIVFTAENANSRSTKYNLEKIPGMGHNHDVWIMTSDGDRYWRLTDYPDNWGAIRPSFSHDGSMIYWNEEYSMEVYPEVGSKWDLQDNNKGEEWGLWRIKYADIAFGSDGPVISNIQTVDVNDIYSGFRLGEGSGFTPDDKGLIFAAFNVNEQGGKMVAEDEYVTDLQGHSLVRLTDTPYQGDENAEYSPDGRKIAWKHHDSRIAGRGTELYLMDADGSNKTRLTHLTERRSSEYVGMTYGSGELDWGPEGGRIVAGFIDGQTPGKWPYLTWSLYMVTFEGACGALGAS